MRGVSWISYLRELRATGSEQLPALAPLWLLGEILVEEAAPPVALDQNGNAYFNPHYLAELASVTSPVEMTKQLGYYWIRGLGHLLCQHAARARSSAAEPWRWQLAAEWALGRETWPGFDPLPMDQPPQVEAYGLPPDRTVEFYYQQLQKQALRPQVVAERARIGNYAYWDGGSAVHGLRRPWELASAASAAGRASEWEQAIVCEQVRSGLLGSPSAPPTWRGWTKSGLRAKVDWRQELGRYLQRNLPQLRDKRLDYSYQRPARRAWGTGDFMLPSLSVGAQLSVAVVLDSSASMRQSYLEQAVAETLQVLRSLRTPLVLIPCDTQAHQLLKVAGSAQLADFPLAVGGGTDLRWGIIAALELRPRPDLLLVLTDGETPWPEAPPPVPVIVGQLRASQQSTSVGRFPEWLVPSVIPIAL